MNYYRISLEDLKEWNKKIKESSFIFSLDHKNDITINITSPLDYNRGSINRVKNNMDRKKFLFSFSVCEKRIEDFQDILNRFNDQEFTQSVVFGNNSVKLEKSTNFKMKKNIHKYNNRNFILFTYEFNDMLQNIMAKITLIEDAIKFFSMKWSYDESGKENYLLKNGIGDIVSTTFDTNGDYIISDLHYSKTSDSKNHYEIQYDINKIENETGSTIKYSDTIRCLEKDLKINRKNRLKYILN